MAVRQAWIVKFDRVIHEFFEFQWYPGFALSQTQKSIRALHESIKNITGHTALEVSSKSENELGRELSAFNLMLGNYHLENVFQASKVYENGGPYIDLLDVEPERAKKDSRHKSSGKLQCFEYENEKWELEPKTMFYDYIYIKAVVNKYGWNLNLSQYEWFTDLMFDHTSSINCQARSLAIYKLIQKLSKENKVNLDSILEKSKFKEFREKLGNI